VLHEHGAEARAHPAFAHDPGELVGQGDEPAAGRSNLEYLLVYDHARKMRSSDARRKG
jgi:hypothetical protein